MTFFFLDLLCKHVFKHYYWLGPYSLFHKLCIKNPKMLHLTSHKFYFQVAGQGNVILRIPIFTTFCYAKNMMWVDFKCHKFNNSHFILVTKVTIHYHKKKKDPIFADLDTYNSCYTQIYGKKKILPFISHLRHQVPIPSIDISSIQYQGITETKVYTPHLSIQVLCTFAKHMY